MEKNICLSNVYHIDLKEFFNRVLNYSIRVGA